MPATISLGSTGDDVKRLQRVLARHLLWSPFGPITGTFDSSLETAVKSFQQANGLTVQRHRRAANLGGPAKLSRSLAAAGARIPRSGCCVAPEDAFGCKRRRTIHAYTGAIDGIFGPATDASVRALQTWGGVTVDGIVGDDSWFVWMTPGSAQQLTLEGACGLTNGLL